VKEGCMAVRCERCGSESELMMRSVLSDIFLCPACLESEIKSQLTKSAIQVCREADDTDRNMYPPETDPVEISNN
jgi:hypothetical protein